MTFLCVEMLLLQNLHFLIAGVQKAGTTALWHYLSQHQQIRFGSRKELHFFDNERLNWDSPDYELLHREFAEDSRDKGLVFGDATPICTYWTPCHKRIHTYNPNIKLIISLRDPIERAFSHWRMETRRNAEDLPFSEAIRNGRNRVTEQAQRDGLHRVYSYVERGFYALQIMKLLDLFPREQLLFLRSNAIAEDRALTLARIATFLDISGFPDMPANRLHVAPMDGAELSRADIAYLRSLYREDVIKLSKILGASFDNWLTMRN